ncbi:hypothetical protein [Trichloromonas sp.]|uniref:hypothetical protein n=1 Tax=Trichloromonas sp. TaxID=3069249 RepID=UPI002A3BD954|nr:hypothetical protein [Trichloromonas sp.]
MKTQQIGTRLSTTDLAKIEAAAKKLGVRPAEIMRIAVRQFLDTDENKKSDIEQITTLIADAETRISERLAAARSALPAEIYAHMIAAKTGGATTGGQR